MSETLGVVLLAMIVSVTVLPRAVGGALTDGYKTFCEQVLRGKWDANARPPADACPGGRWIFHIAAQPEGAK
jgi:hypothetical protein